MGLSPWPDYRRFLHVISEIAIFEILRPPLEHLLCILWNYRRYYFYLHCFLWDYRRDLIAGDTSIWKTAILETSAPLLEHFWCFLWDYRRYI